MIIILVATFSYLLAVCECQGENKLDTQPETTSTPNRTHLDVNETVIFSCPVPSNWTGDRDNITWYQNYDTLKPGIFLIRKVFKKMNVTGDNLEISKTELHHGGLYKCCWSPRDLVEKDYLEWESDEWESDEYLSDICALVRFPTPAIIGGGTSRTRAVLDDKVNFECLCDGYPKPAAYWRRENDAPFFNGELTYNGTEVVIPRMTEKDAGIYYAYCHNGVGKMKHWVTKVELITRSEMNQLLGLPFK